MEAITKLWQYLEDGLWMLSDIQPLARVLDYWDGEKDMGYYTYQSNPISYWERNALFAMIILAAEGEDLGS